MMSEKKGSAYLKRQARREHNERFWKKLIPSVLAAILILVVLAYVISLMYTRFGSFTVSVNKYHALQYGLSLSEDRFFSSPTSRLNCKASEEIDNIDGAILDEIDIGAVDGNDSGDNYLCYTFYCKNSGTESFSFTYSINIANMTMGIEKAVRIRLITNLNGEKLSQVDYARAAGVDDDGNAVAEPGTTPFLNKTTIMQDNVLNFSPDDVMKYTVVIWLEGNDPDCVDSVIGGVMKVDMKFSVIGTDAQQDD
ncbi:MAG: hypothetical protein KIG20_04215 [Eubacteriales bacterium]|nr:hypothetical protein [Eubacteriales bacterium]